MASGSIRGFLSWLNETGSSRITRSDGYLIAVYWLVAIPFIWFTNIGTYGTTTTLLGALFTVVLNTGTVWLIYHTLFHHILPGRQYIMTFIVLILLLAVLGSFYLLIYGLLFDNKLIRFSFINIAYGMVEHVRSYGTLFVLAIGKKIFELLLQLERSERLKAESELKLIRTQIHPHFLFNTLNNLSSLVEGTNPRATDLLQRLSGLLRYTLYKSGNRQVALEDELSFLQNYFSIQETRCNDPSKLDFTIHGDPRNLKIAPGILITFLENAFKHGISTSRENAGIKIHIDIKDHTLHFRTLNTKNGIAEKYAPGIGIQNARKNLQLQYKDKHQLDITDKGSRFFVNLKLKLYG